MVLISCLDSVEGARGLGELFSICEFRMVNKWQVFWLVMKAKTEDPKVTLENPHEITGLLGVQ